MANLGVVGSPVAPKEMTLTDRLTNAARNLDNNCDRLETVLCRVNGTPGSASATAKQPAGNPSTVDTVNDMERICQRLALLAEGVERIA